MKPFALYYFCTLILLLFLSGCDQNNSVKENETAIDEEIEGSIAFNPEDYKNEEIIFYNLFSPVELTYLISKKESYYNSSLINSINNITKYSESTKVALNLGIYGADISYLWMFEQSQQSLSYRAAIQRLTDKLEIPRDFVNFTYSSAESNAQNFDSLVHISKVSYLKTDEYLKKTGRNHSASFILLGGWIETLYIATHMYENPDAKLMSKIAIQSFSLNSLISLLQQSQDNINVSEYLLLLKKLKGAFDDLKIQYPPESLLIDTSTKHIKLKNPESIKINAENLSEIRRLTKQIREHIIH
jgi:hypothetical protein